MPPTFHTISYPDNMSGRTVYRVDVAGNVVEEFGTIHAAARKAGFLTLNHRANFDSKLRRAYMRNRPAKVVSAQGETQYYVLGPPVRGPAAEAEAAADAAAAARDVAAAERNAAAAAEAEAEVGEELAVVEDAAAGDEEVAMIQAAAPGKHALVAFVGDAGVVVNAVASLLAKRHAR